MSATRVLGAVLCGGASRRMGVDKALLGSPTDPLAGHVASALAAAGVDEVLLVGGDRNALAGLPHRWMPDDEPGSGPLGAVATITRHVPDTALVVCACDLPHLVGCDLRPLVAALEAGADAHRSAGSADAADALVFDVEGIPQWSVLGLSPDGAAFAAVAFDTGERALHRALTSPMVRLVHLRPDRPDRLRDADVPDDLPPAFRGTAP